MLLNFKPASAYDHIACLTACYDNFLLSIDTDRTDRYIRRFAEAQWRHQRWDT